MPRRPTYWHMVQASKGEALFAVDAYNRSRDPRSLEAFVVHMHLAWLYLLHAVFRRDKIEYREKRGRRFVRVDGEPKTWELRRCVARHWSAEAHPIRRNIEFFIGLRNRVEHHHIAEDHARALRIEVAGFAQAHVLNYEEEVVREFGVNESLADSLRFPVFISTLTDSGLASIRRIRRRLGKGNARYIDDFVGSMVSEVAEDPRFEFRVHLLPRTGPKSSADMAIEFVKLSELSEEQRRALESVGRTGTVITRVREVAVPYGDAGWHRPASTAAAIGARVPGFRLQPDFVNEWREHHVRPPTETPDPAATDRRYCLYDAETKAYVYSAAFVELVVTCRAARTQPESRSATND